MKLKDRQTIKRMIADDLDDTELFDDRDMAEYYAESIVRHIEPVIDKIYPDPMAELEKKLIENQKRLEEEYPIKNIDR